MSELVILCNEQEIYCDSEKYYCDGSVVKLDEEYSTAAYFDVDYDNIRYYDENYGIFNFFLDSDNKFLLVSSGDFFRVKGTTDIDNIRY